MLRKVIAGGGIGLLAFLVGLALWQTGRLTPWEQDTWDLRARVLAREGPNTDRIRLVLLDQPSLSWAESEMGLQWPWPREVYAPILQFCKRAGARCVAFDVLFTESSRYGVADDEVLGEAVKDNGTFIGTVYLEKTLKQNLAMAWPPDWSGPAFPVADPAGGPLPKSWSRPSADLPIPELTTSARLLGNVQEDPDSDSIFRHLHLFREFDGSLVPSLGMAAYLVGTAGDGGWPPIHQQQGRRVTVGPQRYLLDGEGRGLLRFRSADSYPTFSAAAVIQSELRLAAGEKPVIDPALFEDAYVLFGFSAPGLKDLRPTPMQAAAPGVMVHATLLDNLLAGDLLYRLPMWMTSLLVLLLGITAATAVVFCSRTWQSVAVLVVAFPLPSLLGLWGYAAGYALPVVPTQVVVFGALVGALVYQYATEGRQQRFIRKAFRCYLSPAVIEQILEDPDMLQLGGERKELSIFFSDIRGFSSFSEKLDPTALTELLNDFLSRMTEIIQQEGGTVDKYIGDAIVAFWNAPVDQADHPARAVRAAQHCQEELSRLRPDYRARYDVDLHLRIGLNTGTVVVGNMGSRERFDYTVLGDAANLSSRLEGANKLFGSSILVNETTWTRLEQGVPGRRLGALRVVGRNEPATVYEPYGSASAGSAEQDAAWTAALALVAKHAWAEAVEAFAPMAERDSAARLYAERCRKLMDGTLEDWDGIWNLTEKG